MEQTETAIASSMDDEYARDIGCSVLLHEIGAVSFVYTMACQNDLQRM